MDFMCARICEKPAEMSNVELRPPTESDESVYAPALEKLYRENQLPAVNINDRQTHPHLYDRMLAAGITPNYPRPGRPKKMTWVGTVYACAFKPSGSIRSAYQGEKLDADVTIKLLKAIRDIKNHPLPL